jgi:DNA-binding transcriptional ArsR family regulator
MSTALTRTLHALADPTRREILRMLGERDMTAGEIGANFDMSAPSISHHLNTLKQAELVIAERRGQSIVYSLNATVVQEFLQTIVAALEPKKRARKRKTNQS